MTLADMPDCFDEAEFVKFFEENPELKVELIRARGRYVAASWLLLDIEATKVLRLKRTVQNLYYIHAAIWCTLYHLNAFDTIDVAGNCTGEYGWTDVVRLLRDPDNARFRDNYLGESVIDIMFGVPNTKSDWEKEGF